MDKPYAGFSGPGSGIFGISFINVGGSPHNGIGPRSQLPKCEGGPSSIKGWKGLDRICMSGGKVPEKVPKQSKMVFCGCYPFQSKMNKMTQNDPKIVENGPKRSENGPEWSKTTFYDLYSFGSKVTKMTQNDPKLAQNSPKRPNVAQKHLKIIRDEVL